MSNLDGNMKGFWKMRDLKRVIRKVKEVADDEGILDDLEEFVSEKLVEILIEEITSSKLYQELKESVLERIGIELEGE